MGFSFRVMIDLLWHGIGRMKFECGVSLLGPFGSRLMMADRLVFRSMAVSW